MEPVTPPAIISPPLNCDSFEAGGVTYTRTPTLALGRARLLQRFQTELQFNMGIPAVQRALVEVVADLNGLKLVDGCAKLRRLMDGADLLGANRMREAEIVALFYNAPDEDPTTYDHAAITRKVDTAWGAVDADFFTRQAFAQLLRTSTHYPSLEEVAAEAAQPDPA
ncbi:hypothetical protein [Hymenobacter ruber]